MGQDAQFLEHWLLSEWDNIINLFNKFQRETGWPTKRCNEAFHEVFRKSKKVTW